MAFYPKILHWKQGNLWSWTVNMNDKVLNHCFLFNCLCLKSRLLVCSTTAAVKSWQRTFPTTILPSNYSPSTFSITCFQVKLCFSILHNSSWRQWTVSYSFFSFSQLQFFFCPDWLLLSGLGIVPQTRRLLVRFWDRVGARAPVAGQVLAGGMWGATYHVSFAHWCFSASLSFLSL